MNGVDWGKFLTPEGITALVALLGLIASIVSTVAARFGNKALAQRASEVEEDLQAHKQQVANLVAVTSSVIKGVQDARDKLTPEHAQQLIDTIQGVAKGANVETTLQAVVKAVTEGKGTVQEAVDAKPSIVLTSPSA